MYKITKHFHFSASHQIRSLPNGHPCKELHGHNYIVIIELCSRELNEYGFVVDLSELASLKEMIDTNLDHKHLNDVLPYEPTTENLARFLYDWAKTRWAQTCCIKVSETPKIWAEYSEE